MRPSRTTMSVLKLGIAILKVSPTSRSGMCVHFIKERCVKLAHLNFREHDRLSPKDIKHCTVQGSFNPCFLELKYKMCLNFGGLFVAKLMLISHK